MTREWIENSSLEQVDKERAMTREEAIDIMKVVIHMLDDDYDDRVEIAIQMAIEALQAEPVVHCKDCKSQKTCKFAQWQGNYGYCSQGERREP